MIILLTTVHVIACIILVLVVLLQAGKGADMGAVFGGASSTIFGSSGAGNFLTRLTTGAAIVFMATSLGLTYIGSHGGSSTIMPASAPVPQAAAPEQAAGTDSEAAAVADGAPAAAPAEGGNAAPADAKGNADAPAAEAPAPAPAPEAAAPAAP